MNKDSNLVCKVLLPKRSPNAEQEIYRIGDFPATLAELQERVNQKCSLKLPAEYNLAYEMPNGDLKTVLTENDFSELIKLAKDDKAQKTVRFHIIEKKDNSLEDLEKMLFGMKSFEFVPDKQFSKLEDISMTVSVIGGPCLSNHGPISIIAEKEKQNLVIPANDQNIDSCTGIENLEKKLAQENCSLRDDAQIKINSQVEVHNGLEKNEKFASESKKQIEEEKQVGLMQNHQERPEFGKDEHQVDESQEIILNGWRLTKEQSEVIKELINQRVSEVEAQLSARYELICEQKIQRLNEEWTQRFVRLEAAVEHLKIADVPKNEASEEKKEAELFENKERSMDFKKIKFLDLQDLDAIITREPVINISNLGPQAIYEVTFSLKNIGTGSWPKNTVIECINGNHEGEFRLIGDKKAGEEVKMTMQFPYPNKPGTYLSSWRLYASKPEEQAKNYFGPKVSFEVKVEELQNQKSENIVPEDIESKYSKEVIEKADLIKSVLNVNKLKALEFVNRDPSANIEELVNNYYNQV